MRSLTGAVDGCVCDVRARHNSFVAANTQGDAGRGCGARICVSTLSRVVPGAADLAVVSTDNGRWKVKQCSAGI